ISANRVWTTSLSRMTVITWRRACRSPRLAKVTSFSANGRSRFAFASVVVIRPCSNSDVAKLASISRSCEGDPPRRGPLVGVGMSVLPQAPGARAGAVRVLPKSLFSVAGREARPDGGVGPPSGRGPAAGPCAAPSLHPECARDGGRVLSELLGLLVGALVVRLPVVR